MATVELTKDNFEQVVTGSDMVVVDFWAPWCAPCRAFAPSFEAASEKHQGVVFAKVNTEDQPDLAGVFQIRSIPSLMVFRDGMLVVEQPGMLPAAALEKVVQQVRALDMDDVKLHRDGYHRLGNVLVPLDNYGPLIEKRMQALLGRMYGRGEKFPTTEELCKEIGRDLGLWAMAFGGAGVASLWPVDPWALVLLVLGAAASVLAPAVLLPRHGNQPRAATLAGCVGLTVFALLAAAGPVRGRALDGLLAVAAGFPAVAALPAALGVLWLAGRRAPE